jgi:prevent-host-death family protein
MTQTVSVAEASSRLESLLRQVSDHRDDIVIERQGKPAAVLIPFTDYEKWRRLREQERAAALEEFRQLGERIAAPNQDLTEEQAIALADEVAHEIIDDMAARGVISFERDRR